MNELTEMRYDASVCASFDIALSFSSVQEALETLVRNSIINHTTFCIKNSTTTNFTPPYCWTTHPGKWITRYQRQSYYLYDPIFCTGFSKTKPFFWSDLKTELKEKHLLEDAARHGIGPNGYCIPLNNKGNLAILSVSSNEIAINDWRYYINSIKHVLCQFSRSIHQRAMDELKMENANLLAN